MAFSWSSRVRSFGGNSVCFNKPRLIRHRVVSKWGAAGDDGYQAQKMGSSNCKCSYKAKWNFQPAFYRKEWNRLLDSIYEYKPEMIWNFQQMKITSRKWTRLLDSISAAIFSTLIESNQGAGTVSTEAKGKVDFMSVLRQCTSVKYTVFMVALAALLAIPSANAVDALKTCTCLLKECRLELARCISNPSCAANVACLQTCNNRPDETECQIKCGDLFENSVVDEFNECAVSRKKCVPRKSDVGEFPVPDPAVLVSNFNLDSFTGKWYITSGLNPSFDTFDCQVHEFQIESGRLVGNLSWRIRTPDTGFITRTAIQKFVQDPKYPGILYNHDNEFLHYQDDWYIISSKVENQPDDYVFVYYRGSNDAWDGYGGAVVYTRSSVLPESIVPELEKAAKNVNRDFGKFKRMDNSCRPEPLLAERLERTMEEGEEIIAKEVEEIEEEIEQEVRKVASTEATLFQRLYEGFQELLKDGNYFLKELSQEEMELLKDLKMEASEIEELFSGALPIRKLR